MLLLLASLLAGGHQQGEKIREGMTQREPNGIVEVGGQDIGAEYAPVEEGGEEGNEGGSADARRAFQAIFVRENMLCEVKIITSYLSTSYMTRLITSEENITSHFFSKNRPRAEASKNQAKINFLRTF